MKLVQYILISLSLLAVCEEQARAQMSDKVYFTGVGRVETANSSLSGEKYKNDTVSKNIATGGQTLFDLGIHIQPTPFLRATSIIRLQNQFGTFFGQGSTVQIRQLKLDGLMGEKLHYALGDIDVQMTPFTFYNDADTSLYESDVFSFRKDIVYYDNLNVGNAWRVQGAKAKSLFYWGDSTNVSSLVQGFIVRNRAPLSSATNEFVAGVRLNNSIGPVSLNYNYTYTFDQKNLKDQINQFDINVSSLALSYVASSSDIGFRWGVESGLSDYKRTLSDSSSRAMNDGFAFSEVEFEAKKVGFKISINYRYIGEKFTSPAAQTLRVNNFVSTDVLSNSDNGTALRTPLVFDRETQLGMYNTSVSSSLMSYLPYYGNVTPYGLATPDRAGLGGEMEFEPLSKFISARVGAKVLRRISSSDYTYTTVDGGLLVRIDSIIGSKKGLSLNANFIHEATKASGIDFTTTLVDFGFKIETFKHLYCLVGYKVLSIKGTENIYSFNALNEITTTKGIWDESQGMFAFGVAYYFSSKSSFSCTAYLNQFQDALSSSESYGLNQYYLNYTLKF